MRCHAGPRPRTVGLRSSVMHQSPTLPSFSLPRQSLRLMSAEARVEPELVRPVSPGYRLRREPRKIPPRQTVVRGTALADARAALQEREKNGGEVLYSDLGSLLERAARGNDFATARQVLTEINRRGFKHTSARGLRSLMQAYARSDQLADVEWTAQQLMMYGHTPDVWCYNAWISSLVRQRKVKEAEAKFSDMQRLGMAASVVTYHALLSGYASEGDKTKVMEILAEMERLGLPWTEYTWTPLIHMYARRGEPTEVRSLIERLEASGVTPSVRVFNSLLSALAKANQFDRMPAVLRQMTSLGVMPVTETYNTMIAAHAKLADFAAVEERLNEMKGQKLPLDLLTFAPIVAARCKRGELEEAEAILKEMNATSVVPSIAEGMLVINGWLSAGCFDRARQVLILLESCGTALCRPLFVPLVTAFAEARRFVEADELVDDMRRRNLPVDGWISRFGKQATLNDGKPSASPSPSFSPSSASNFDPSSSNSSASSSASPSARSDGPAWTAKERTSHIRNLLKAERSREAERVLASMVANGPAPTAFTYTLMMGHYGGSGNFTRIEELLAEMKQRGLEPDAFTYSKLLRSYAHHKRAAEALLLWEKLRVALKKENKEPPSAQNYHDAIFSLVVQHDIDKAAALCEEMHAAKVKPLGATFVWLIGACLSASKREEALRWTERMVASGYTLTEPLAGKVRQLRAEADAALSK